MKDECYSIKARALPPYDVVVAGGGLAGAAAALRAAENGARVLLIESGGELGGDITKGIVPQLLDPDGKGGTLRELYRFLQAGDHTSVRKGARYTENGRRIPGTVVDTEYIKYYLSRELKRAGVELLYHAIVMSAELDGERITSLLVATECGVYRAQGHVFVDATGNGAVAAMCGCAYECGHPESGHPQPASLALLVTGIDTDAVKTDSSKEKAALKALAEREGVSVSAEGISVIPTAIDGVTLLTFNNQYDVYPDDALALSRATTDARIEQIEVLEALKRALPALRGASALATSSHIGIREGRRIVGRYTLTREDILCGRRFEDGICLVKFPVDVHRISKEDRTDHSEGKHPLPYHIPYRAMLPIGVSNLLLAGRCISGDFYAHASYRVAGNVLATGDAAGFASAVAAREGVPPLDIDGGRVGSYMRTLGYEL